MDREELAETIRRLPYPYALADNDHFRRVWSLACDAAAREVEKATFTPAQPPPAGEQVRIPGTNSGHGHVWKRPDGHVARCGGPSLCRECRKDKEALEVANIPPPSHASQQYEAAGRLRAWIRDFGSDKSPSFIADLEAVLAAFTPPAPALAEQAAELKAKLAAKETP